MKLYERLFSENLSLIKEIAAYKREQKDLNKRVPETRQDSAEWFDLYDQLGNSLEAENVCWALLAQTVDEAYHMQPFKHVREKGKVRFYTLCHNYISSLL